MVVGKCALCFTALRRPNAALWWATGATTALIALILAWPPATRLFHFGPLHLDDLAICGGAGLATLVLLDLFKPLWRSRLTN